MLGILYELASIKSKLKLRVIFVPLLEAILTIAAISTTTSVVHPVSSMRQCALVNSDNQEINFVSYKKCGNVLQLFSSVTHIVKSTCQIQNANCMLQVTKISRSRHLVDSSLLVHGHFLI